MITNFKDKKLVEYLEKGKKFLIRFGHGLGDTIMFLPILKELRSKYPDCVIDLYVEAGQEHIFGDTLDKEGEGYDLVFSLDFPMSEGSELTKAEKCCLDEIGIDYKYCGIDLEVSLKEHKEDNPFVVVHFQGTALPDSVSCSEEVAKKIWQEIKECGKIPIECHFHHIFHNPKNDKFDFVNRHVRDCNADIKTLVGMIQNSYAFIGVASGPFIVALASNPDRTLYLEKNHPLKSYTKLDIARIDIKDYKEGSIKEWLKNTQSQ
jgi:hypothetical protein